MIDEIRSIITDQINRHVAMQETHRAWLADDITTRVLAEIAKDQGPKTAEAMFADKDRFVGYIADVVNPARLKDGLGCINMGQAGICYDVLTQRRYRNPKGSASALPPVSQS